MKKFRSIGLYLLVLLPLFSCERKEEVDLILSDVAVVDVLSGEIRTHRDVIISEEKIIAIYEHDSDRPHHAAIEIPAAGQYVIPGLWDMHTHTWWGYDDFFPLLIANGVTGIREMFGDIKAVKIIRDKIAMDSLLGPEIVTAGPIIDGVPALWPESAIAATPQEGRELVRQQFRDGADFIKVYSYLDRETYFAIADECQKLGIPFSGHIPDKVTLEEAIEAGQHSSEHFLSLLEYCSAQHKYYYEVIRGQREDTLLTGEKGFINTMAFLQESFSPQRLDSLIQLVGQSDLWICPTSTVNRAFAYIDTTQYKKFEHLTYMPDYAVRNWDPQEQPWYTSKTAEDFKIWKNWYHLGLSTMKPMLDGGVKFLAGTDYPNAYTYPGFSLHDELEIFVEAGFTNLQALQTATINPAKYLNRTHELGTIETGKLANLVLLERNPLESISNTKTISGVVLRGRYISSEENNKRIKRMAKKHTRPKIREELLPIVLKKNVAAAIAHYKKLRETEPDAFNFDEEQLNTLGYDLLTMKRWDQALAIFQFNLALHPDYANGYDSLGDAYRSKKDTVKALAAYQEAIERGMGDVTQTKLDKLQGQRE
jgi:imidazolonepropionase-like amidohydrolase